MMDYIVAACTVKHIFHQEVEPFEENWLNEDDSILLWIETARLSEQDMVDFTVLLEEVDSLIVFGKREDVELVKDGIFDADSIENIIENMDLNIHLEQPVGGQYFRAGDSVEELYEALNRYVQEETN